MKTWTKIRLLLATIALALAAVGLIYLSNSEHFPPADQRSESVSGVIDGWTGERSSKWSTVRNQFVAAHPVCEACGTSENLNVHHIKPFHNHPELELDLKNLITLCSGSYANGRYNCHFKIGHDPDGPAGSKSPNWMLSNPRVRLDARSHRQRLELAP